MLHKVRSNEAYDDGVTVCFRTEGVPCLNRLHEENIIEFHRFFSMSNLRP